MTKSVSATVSIVEVGPRDGLQNEPYFVPTEAKLQLIEALAKAGLRRIEVAAFVSPKWVPQMRDHDAVMRGAVRHPGGRLMALVPNAKGAEAAIAAGAGELAVFTSASETFAQKNTNCSIAENIARFGPVMELAKTAEVPVRGYISCAVDCPYEGATSPEAVAALVSRLNELGCDEIVLADTIGRATPERAAPMIERACQRIDASRLACHFHDTNGMATDNVGVAWDFGIRIFDSAVGGLGGCPYAPGAAGNVGTGKLVDYFERRGISTGIDRQRLRDAEHLVLSWKSAGFSLIRSYPAPT